jgi:tetratricopeptide (TPR) repeat protein
MYLKITLIFATFILSSCSTNKNSDTRWVNSDILEADRLTKDGLYREAISKYSQSVKKFPDDMRAYRTLGILLVKTGQYKKSIKYLTQALEDYPQDFETNYYMAEALRTLDRYEDAIFRYRTALNDEPDNVSALKALSWTYYKIGYYTATLNVAKKLKKLQPKDFQHSIIAARAFLKMNKKKSALKLLEAAKMSCSKSQLPYLLSVEADAYLALSKLKKAESTYRLVLKDQPLLASALLGLGKTLLYKGTQKEKALSYIERSHRLRPKMIEAKYILAKELKNIDKKKARYFQKAFYRQYKKDPLLAKRAIKGHKNFAKLYLNKTTK